MPLKIGRQWLVLPEENPVPKTKRTVLRIRSGMGFGSGDHETTQLCLKLLENVRSCSSFLDVGTGSGILAIAASKLGFHRVVAIEKFGHS